MSYTRDRPFRNLLSWCRKGTSGLRATETRARIATTTAPYPIVWLRVGSRTFCRRGKGLDGFVGGSIHHHGVSYDKDYLELPVQAQKSPILRAIQYQRENLEMLLSLI